MCSTCKGRGSNGLQQAATWSRGQWKGYVVIRECGTSSKWGSWYWPSYRSTVAGMEETNRWGTCLSPATREVWVQGELLELREGVLYLRSPEITPSVKIMMVLPQKLVKGSLLEVHDGLAGAYLGKVKTLKKMKTRFWRPGLTNEVHWHCSSCLTCGKCKPGVTQRQPCIRYHLETLCRVSILT